VTPSCGCVDLTAVVIHPIHDEVPSLVCYMAPTCNKFKKEHCQAKYAKLKEMAEACGLTKTLGPAVGGASDGDPKRRAMQAERA